MNTPADTYELTLMYLRIVFGGLPLVMGYNLFSGFLRSVGNSRTPLIAITCSAICNILLDVLFVVCFRWSVTGVAIATVISQALSCLICLVAVLRPCWCSAAGRGCNALHQNTLAPEESSYHNAENGIL